MAGRPFNGQDHRTNACAAAARRPGATHSRAASTRAPAMRRKLGLALGLALGWALAGALAVASPLAADAAGPAAKASRDDPPPGEYRVVNGRVDRGTYTGWLLYHTTCYGCHGVDGTGSEVAPNLVQRVRGMTPRAFVTKVLTSYRITQAPEGGVDDREALIDDILSRRRGSRGRVTMPAWEGDEKVSAHVLDLFAYLNARADGQLGPGRPRLIAAPR